MSFPLLSSSLTVNGASSTLPHGSSRSIADLRTGQRLVRLVEQLSDHAERYRRVDIAGDPRSWSVGAAEHRKIYEAAERGDANGASEATVRHLARTALTVLANLAPEHDPSLVRGAMRASLAASQDQDARSPRRNTTS
jgi:hypothetical protein